MERDDATEERLETRLARWRRVLLRYALPVLVAAFAWWFGGGYRDGRAFEHRVERLKRSGVIAELSTFEVPMPPEDENGYALLVAFWNTARDLETKEKAAIRKSSGWDALPPPEPLAQWTDQERESGRRLLAAMAPALDTLDEALARSEIVAPFEEALRGRALGIVVQVLLRLKRYALLHPETGKQQVDRMLRLYDRWRPTAGVRTTRSVMLHTVVLPRLQAWLEASPDEAPSLWWHVVLLREEDQARRAVHSAQAYNRAGLANLLQAWRRGEDPMKELRENLDEVMGPLRRFGGMDERLSALRDSLDGFRGPVLDPPPYQAWYQRPLLEQLCLEVVEAMPDKPAGIWNVKQLRNLVASLSEAADKDARMTLRSIAALRYARAAVLARTVLTGPSDDASDDERIRRALKAARAVGDDPLSGSPLEVIHEGSVMVIGPHQSRAREVVEKDAFHDNATLRWVVPLR